MDEKNFLIIDGILIPDMESNSLKIYQKDLDQYIRMISGRLVCEGRGYYWAIEADFSDIDAGLLNRLDNALAAKKEHQITFLPPTGKAETITSAFYLTGKPVPSLKSWMEELPEWSGVSYTFEEVRPNS